MPLNAWIGKKLIRITLYAVAISLAACHAQSTKPELVLDGASQQSFFNSMAAMKGHLQESEFEKLVWAVGYLQVHELEPLTLDDFYASLDGYSAARVIARAEKIAQP